MRHGIRRITRRVSWSDYRSGVSGCAVLRAGGTSDVPLVGTGKLRVHQDINQPFSILKYIIITRWIVRLRTEDRLLSVRSVDHCAPSAAIAPDHNAIPPVVLLLRSQCLSLYQPYTIARQAFTFVSMQRGRGYGGAAPNAPDGRRAASRRSVLIRSPGLRGIRDGTTTMQLCSDPVSCR